MLIRKEHIDNGGILGIWKIEETPEEILSFFSESLRKNAVRKLSSIKSDRRIMEWLAVRALLHTLTNEEKTIHHETSGRPTLADASFHISISHSGKYVVILLHPRHNVGIDIELRSNRILRVAERFVSEREYIDSSQRTLHLLLHWSAKETLFKLLDTKEVDFKTHLFIEPFNPTQKGTMLAREFKTTANHSFQIFYEIHPEYVMTWGVESPKKE